MPIGVAAKVQRVRDGEPVRFAVGSADAEMNIGTGWHGDAADPGLRRGAAAAIWFELSIRRNCLSAVMPAHSRPKDGVALLAYVAAIHVFHRSIKARRGWPGHQARP
jgi:hypothetical protein